MLNRLLVVVEYHYKIHYSITLAAGGMFTVLEKQVMELWSRWRYLDLMLKIQYFIFSKGNFQTSVI